MSGDSRLPLRTLLSSRSSTIVCLSELKVERSSGPIRDVGPWGTSRGRGCMQSSERSRVVRVGRSFFGGHLILS